MLHYLLDRGAHVKTERLDLGLALPRIGFEPPENAGLGGLKPEPTTLGAKIRPTGRVYGIMEGGAKMRDRCLCKTVQESVSGYGVQINTILEF